jgi:hypothetical protein
MKKEYKEESLRFLNLIINANPLDFIGLSSEELENLPDESKLCIENIKITETTYQSGRVKKTINIKLFDKIKAIEALNKQIGFYKLSNKEKDNGK